MAFPARYKRYKRTHNTTKHIRLLLHLKIPARFIFITHREHILSRTPSDISIFIFAEEGNCNNRNVQNYTVFSQCQLFLYSFWPKFLNYRHSWPFLSNPFHRQNGLLLIILFFISPVIQSEKWQESILIMLFVVFI